MTDDIAKTAATQTQVLALELGLTESAQKEIIQKHLVAMLAMERRDKWERIETAPKDRTPVIIAVPTKDRDDYIVGEAYFDPEHYGDGDWWWAGNSHGDYHDGPISDINYHGPTHWQHLPTAPEGGEQP
ncbi:hypothetical protein CO661_13965 [Sinorhizobium fredii]|uniref:DUF551 domain-containing protein n=1 Tax=Rhizobium fredii TaxID=380 RepID=A0A2A6LXC2_RHIFR|nr:DUF551 domain-containing protein [Sinorhizobium fredii]PDT47283.1 hypothetical protein CO661_13965 [Sinorhizobium fredii]